MYHGREKKTSKTISIIIDSALSLMKVIYKHNNSKAVQSIMTSTSKKSNYLKKHITTLKVDNVDITTPSAILQEEQN